MAKSSHRNFGYNQSAEQNEIENMRDRRGKRIFRKERNIDGTTNYVQKSTGNTVTFDNSVGPKPKERVAYGSGNYEINKAATAAARENTFENSGKSFAENYTRERNRLQEEQWERDAHGGKLKSEWEAIRAKDEEANRQRFFKQNFDTLDAQLQKQGDAEIKAQNIMQGKRIAAAQFLANVMLNGGSLASGLCDDFSNLLGTTVNGASFDKFGNFGFRYDDGNGNDGMQFVSRKAVRESIEGAFGSVKDFLARYQGMIPDNLAHALLGDDVYEEMGRIDEIGRQMDAEHTNWQRGVNRAAATKFDIERLKLPKNTPNSSVFADRDGNFDETAAKKYFLRNDSVLRKELESAAKWNRERHNALPDQIKNIDKRLAMLYKEREDGSADEYTDKAIAELESEQKQLVSDYESKRFLKYADNLKFTKSGMINNEALHDAIVNGKISEDNILSRMNTSVESARQSFENGKTANSEKISRLESVLTGYSPNDASWLGDAVATEASRADDVTSDVIFNEKLKRGRDDLSREDAARYNAEAEAIIAAQNKFDNIPRPTTAKAQEDYKRQLYNLRKMKSDFTEKWDSAPGEKEKNASNAVTGVANVGKATQSASDIKARMDYLSEKMLGIDSQLSAKKLDPTKRQQLEEQKSRYQADYDRWESMYLGRDYDVASAATAEDAPTEVSAAERMAEAGAKPSAMSADYFKNVITQSGNQFQDGEDVAKTLELAKRGDTERRKWLKETYNAVHGKIVEEENGRDKARRAWAKASADDAAKRIASQSRNAESSSQDEKTERVTESDASDNSQQRYDRIKKTIVRNAQQRIYGYTEISQEDRDFVKKIDGLKREVRNAKAALKTEQNKRDRGVFNDEELAQAKKRLKDAEAEYTKFMNGSSK